MDQRLTKIFGFLKEIEKLKLVERIPYLSDKKRRENDAEHSWYVAMMLLSLEKEFENKFDTLRTLKIILIHDLIEIYTGDDWVPTKAGKDLKQVQEEKAADRIFAKLPSDLETEFKDLWKEYDEGKTIEAKIAKALDKLSYNIQHNISKKINWYHGANSYDDIISSTKYAMPYLQDEPVLIQIFEHLMKDREKNSHLFKFTMREKRPLEKDSVNLG